LSEGVELLPWKGKENTMKQGIHPEYYQAKVVCNCGNEFVTGSTKESIRVEICSKCHSFYTGQQKAAAARGAIDKFNRRYGLKQD
jgi:large subunit ribosomal protein L31